MAGIRAQRKAARPGEILEAAFDEFVLNGYAATRIEDIAARVGVTKGTLYVYFDSKDALFVAMVRELSKPMHASLAEPEGEPPGDVRDDLRAYLRRMYRFIVGDPRAREILRLLIAEANRFPALVDEHCAEFMSPVVERLRARLAEGVARGEIRAVDPTHAAEVVLGPAFALNILLLLFANRRSIDVDAFFEAHLDLALEGLLPPRP